MSSFLIPINRSFDPLDTTWDVAPYSGGWNRHDLYDPFAGGYGLGGGMMMPRTDVSLAPAVARSRQAVNQFSPLLTADIIESENDFYVHVDLPGVLPEDLQISIDRGFLELKAQRRQVHEENDVFTNRVERSFGRVSRRLAIPLGADPESTECSFKNGVLTVQFKKLEGVAATGKRLIIK